VGALIENADSEKELCKCDNHQISDNTKITAK